jgi:hypothetical protein
MTCRSSYGGDLPMPGAGEARSRGAIDCSPVHEREQLTAHLLPPDSRRENICNFSDARVSEDARAR